MQHAYREIDKKERGAKPNVKEAGVQFFETPVTDKRRLNTVMQEVAAEWVPDVSAKRGKPADAVYKAFRAALARSTTHPKEEK